MSPEAARCAEGVGVFLQRFGYSFAANEDVARSIIVLRAESPEGKRAEAKITQREIMEAPNPETAFARACEGLLHELGIRP